jgi:thioredoxin reductase (NADPH)
MFVFIGATPYSEWLGDDFRRDSHGFILSGADVTRHGANGGGWKLERAPYLLETSVPGVFVAGDVRNGSVKRVASAVGEGSAAVMFVHQYLSTE